MKPRVPASGRPSERERCHQQERGSSAAAAERRRAPPAGPPRGRRRTTLPAAPALRVVPFPRSPETAACGRGRRAGRGTAGSVAPQHGGLAGPDTAPDVAHGATFRGKYEGFQHLTSPRGLTPCRHSVTAAELRIEGPGRREVVARFDGGRMSSDAGAVLLREADRDGRGDRGGWRRVSPTFATPGRVEHDLEALVAQRGLRSCAGLRGPQRPRRSARRQRAGAGAGQGGHHGGRRDRGGAISATRWPARRR